MTRDHTPQASLLSLRLSRRSREARTAFQWFRRLAESSAVHRRAERSTGLKGVVRVLRRETGTPSVTLGQIRASDECVHAFLGIAEGRRYGSLDVCVVVLVCERSESQPKRFVGGQHSGRASTRFGHCRDASPASTTGRVEGRGPALPTPPRY